MPLDLVARRKWRGMRQSKKYYRIWTPASYVFLGYTNTEACHDYGQCQRQLAYLQSRKGRLNYRSDIAYNFLISSEGVVYEARGWKSRSCLPKRFTIPKRRRRRPESFNVRGYYIGYIGKYWNHPPSRRMKNALNEWLCFAVENEFITKKFTMFTINVHVDRLRREYHRLKGSHEPFLPMPDVLTNVRPRFQSLDKDVKS
ncbi:peptidoglycan-recognition protein 2-like [Macrosteles quadrilineatus]|uniref:peptidoglycan-recognition protein 2-like n=1 Tax=Macrosteles quadrilineatus TaxID=74068 RepID=UPI0023E28C11|nr:peptidoglycan-recognition protein 2-like [Macrosteles quadrilineatus]